MHAVLCLVKDHRMRAVGNRTRDLFPSMRRQAVHYNYFRSSFGHQFSSYLVGGEGAKTPLPFRLLSHAGPGVCVDDVGASDCCVRIGADLLGAITDALPTQSQGSFDHFGAGLVAPRCGNGNVHPHLAGTE